MSLKVTELLTFINVSTMVAKVTFVSTLVDGAKGQGLVLEYPSPFFGSCSTR